MKYYKSTRPVVVVPTMEPVYVFELTQDEAQFLVDVMGCVGGDVVTSRRRFADVFNEALESFGFESKWADDSDKKGGIIFKKEKIL